MGSCFQLALPVISSVPPSDPGPEVHSLHRFTTWEWETSAHGQGTTADLIVTLPRGNQRELAGAREPAKLG